MLLVHGGAGVIRRDLGAKGERAARAALGDALDRGQASLASGGTALDAVVAAVVVLEDAPEFNAGRGAVFTHDGAHELDAAVMDGATLRAGAVAGLRHVRNPVCLARAVLEHSSHVLLAGAGAEAFARSQGIEWVDAGYFDTDVRRAQWQAARQRPDADGEPGHFGTVGAVALDAAGHLAAATSTGGMTGKRWGRIGDSPVIGAGTYANSVCAMSGTGWGEFYIRVAAAHAVCTRVALLHEAVPEAAEVVINHDIPALGGSGGAIVLGADGTFAMPFNTAGMFRGWMGADRAPHVAIGRPT